MANTRIEEVKQEITTNITQNEERKITGQILQTTLKDMMDAVDDQKANTTGYYEGLSVGLADNLKSPDGVSENSAWLYRTTAGDASVSSGFANLQSIKGNTIVWNQMITGLRIATGTAIIDGGKVTIENNANVDESPNIRLIIGHVYLVRLNYISSINGTITLTDYLTGSSTTTTNITSNATVVSYARKATRALNDTINIICSNYVSGTFSGYLNLFDLTQMFGSDAGIVSALGLDSVADITADNGAKAAAAFEQLFPQEYYAYFKHANFRNLPVNRVQKYPKALSRHPRFMPCFSLAGGQEPFLQRTITSKIR